MYMYVNIKRRGSLSTAKDSPHCLRILGIELTNENCGAAAIVTQHMFNTRIKKIEDLAG